MTFRMTKEQLTLSELINALRSFTSSDLWMTFDFASQTPGRLMSYRGFYDHIAIEPLRDGDAGYMYDETPLKFHNRIRECLGQNMQGYKGGTWRMLPETPLWVARYGQTGDTVITGVKRLGIYCVIETKMIEV